MPTIEIIIKGNQSSDNRCYLFIEVIPSDCEVTLEFVRVNFVLLFVEPQITETPASSNENINKFIPFYLCVS